MSCELYSFIKSAMRIPGCKDNVWELRKDREDFDSDMDNSGVFFKHLGKMDLLSGGFLLGLKLEFTLIKAVYR